MQQFPLFPLSSRPLAIRVLCNVQFYLRTLRTLVASAWLSLSRRRAVTSGRAHKYACVPQYIHPRSYERSAPSAAYAIWHAYMQRFLRIGASRCRVDASCGTKRASKLRATIRWQSTVIHMHVASVWENHETWPDTRTSPKIVNNDWFSYTGCYGNYSGWLIAENIRF